MPLPTAYRLKQAFGEGTGPIRQKCDTHGYGISPKSSTCPLSIREAAPLKRNNERFGSDHISDKLKEERSREGDQWPVIVGGVFESLARFDEVLEHHRTDCLAHLSYW